MEFTCSAKDLKLHLNLHSKNIPDKPSHPVLAYILFDVAKGKSEAVLTSSDINSFLQTKMRIEARHSGKMCISPQSIAWLGKTDDKETVHICFDEVEEVLTLKTSASTYQASKMDAEEFPEIPSVTEPPATISTDNFIDALMSAYPASAKDETKQVLTAVNITQSETGLGIRATNGHWANKIDLPCEVAMPEPAPHMCLNIPRKVLPTLEACFLHFPEDYMSLAWDSEDTGKIISATQLRIEFGPILLSVRLQAGLFPEMDKLFPLKFEYEATIPRQTFEHAVQRISIFSSLENKKMPIVRLNLDTARQEISLSSLQVEQGQGADVIKCSIRHNGTAKNREIRVSAKYLDAVLGALSGSEVILKVTDNPQAPLTFEPFDNTQYKQGIVLMPIYN